jgi:hypothetical protein
MSVRPVISDVIDYLQQLQQAHGDIVVVPNDDAVQAPGDYVNMETFFSEFEARQEGEAGGADAPPAPRG